MKCCSTMRQPLARRVNCVKLFAGVCLLAVLNYFLGVTDIIQELSFRDFRYPHDINFQTLLNDLMTGEEPVVSPLIATNFTLLHSPVCDAPFLLILVKSAIDRVDNRRNVRQSWGSEHLNFKVNIRTVFLLGTGEDSGSLVTVTEESNNYKDIVQFDMVDNYWNNTYKAVMGLRWVSHHCPSAHYTLFVDDDYFINTYRVVSLLRAKTKVDDESLYEGFCYPQSWPMRHRLKKWRVEMEEYPYSVYPPFITAGAYLMSNSVIKKFALAAPYVKYLRFDDVFLGILSLKLGIVPRHNEKFAVDRPSYSRAVFHELCGVHMRGDWKAINNIWSDQLDYLKELGEVPR